MNRRTLFFLALPFCASRLLTAQLNTPKAGVVRYPDGTLHSVYGLSANYIVDGRALASADAASFSNAGGLFAKNGQITLTDSSFTTLATYASGESAPILNIAGDLKSAVAWLPTQHALLHWNGTSFVLTQAPASAVLSEASSVRITGANTAKLLLTNSDATVSEATVALDSGELMSLELLPGVHGPAFSHGSFVVFADDAGLAVATSSAVIQTFALPPAALKTPLTFERMSSDALHVYSLSTGQNWILHLGGSLPSRLSQLPAVPTSAAVSSTEAAQ